MKFSTELFKSRTGFQDLLRPENVSFCHLKRRAARWQLAFIGLRINFDGRANSYIEPDSRFQSNT